MFSAAKISLILTFGANSDLFAALVSFCVSVVRGFVVRPLFCLFQATYRFKSVQVACAKRWKFGENKAYFLRVPCGGEGGKYKGGSIRMAAASAAIDHGVPIDVVLNTGRWSSWQVFNKFYNRARLRDVAPSIGLTSLA